MHLRAKSGVGVILHFGAKDRVGASIAIQDPGKLLTWLGKDHAMVTFASLHEVKSQASAHREIVRQWIGFVCG